MAQVITATAMRTTKVVTSLMTNTLLLQMDHLHSVTYLVTVIKTVTSGKLIIIIISCEINVAQYVKSTKLNLFGCENNVDGTT